MFRKPFRVVLIELLANQIRNIFFKHHIQLGLDTEERKHKSVKIQNNIMPSLSSAIHVLKMTNKSELCQVLKAKHQSDVA